MSIQRREFLNSAVMGLTGLVLGDAPFSVSSLLEEAAQPDRKPIGKINDGFNALEILEIYHEGMFLAQHIALNQDYTAENLYFITNGKTGELTEWRVRCDLYRKGSPEAVNSMRVDGSAESGKMVVISKTGPHVKSPVENVLTQGAYIQSSMGILEKMDEKAVQGYFIYLKHQFASFTGDKSKPMPQGYNPLQSKGIN